VAKKQIIQTKSLVDSLGTHDQCCPNPLK